MAERTVRQSRLIYVNKSKLDITENEFRALVSEYTDGTTTKTSEMDEWQADALIRHLKALVSVKMPAMKRMRSKCLYLASEAFGYDLSEGSEDWTQFNNWMKRSGTHKKFLVKLTHNELVDTVTQLEQALKNVDEGKFNNYVEDQLTTLNIPTHEETKD